MIRLSRLVLYPIKSLPGVSVSEAKVLASGALAWDRRFALTAADGCLINGKRDVRVHQLRATFDLGACSIELRYGDGPTSTLSLEDKDELARWFSDAMGESVRLCDEPQTGIPDDPDAPGPTLVSQASLEAAAKWCEVDEAGIRGRFRANLEIDADEPFWEDRLFGRAAECISFRIGEARFLGTGPCARCVVPSRDPHSGQIAPRFASEFSKRRQAELPSWAEASRFDHFYRLSVNTRVPLGCPEQAVSVGDEVVIDHD